MMTSMSEKLTNEEVDEIAWKQDVHYYDIVNQDRRVEARSR